MTSLYGYFGSILFLLMWFITGSKKLLATTFTMLWRRQKGKENGCLFNLAMCCLLILDCCTEVLIPPSHIKIFGAQFLQFSTKNVSFFSQQIWIFFYILSEIPSHLLFFSDNIVLVSVTNKWKNVLSEKIWKIQKI